MKSDDEYKLEEFIKHKLTIPKHLFRRCKKEVYPVLGFVLPKNHDPVEEGHFLLLSDGRQSALFHIDLILISRETDKGILYNVSMVECKIRA